MTRRAQLRAVFCSFALATAAAACSTPTDPHWLVGTWTFESGVDAMVTCSAGPPIKVRIGGAIARISEVVGGVELELGCRCRLRMTAEGGLTESGQACTLVGAQSGPMDTEIAARVDTFTLAPDGAGGLTSRVRGSAVPNQLAQVNMPPSCSFELDSPLARDEVERPRCGDDRTAVGVVAVARSGVCPLRTGIDGLVIVIGNEPESGCAAETGDLGETTVLPANAVKSLPPCRPGAAPADRATIAFNFCRVDGALFKPFVADGTQGNNYALLRLGEECPAGSVKVSKYINNPDGVRSNATLGNIGPNQSGNVPGTFTQLEFCLFQAQEEGAPVKEGFPDVGVAFAVFHDYEGFQPPWVIGKRWLRTDDENSGDGNRYLGPDGVLTDGTEIDELKKMIEDIGNNDTVFDLAYVQ
jgi:hypothetical protein